MIGSLIKRLPILTICYLLGTGSMVQAQSKVLKGIVKDSKSDETIPFASVEFALSQRGILSDSAGNFYFNFNHWPLGDSLRVTYVGYEDFVLPFDSTLLQRDKNDVISVNIPLIRGKYQAAVVVSRKIDRGLLMWRRIVRHKPQNDRYRFDNFSYELYNKLELDIKNIKKEKWAKLPVIKKFNFVLDNIDTTEKGDPFLPVYLTEALSEYYYQKSPLRRREVFEGTKTIGVNNESVSRFLGGMEQNVDFYKNFIPVFDKEFVSPLSDNGDNYYHYTVADTQVVNNRRLIHMYFVPKRKGENTFEGDCWVHDTTWAIQKMNLRLDKEANVNFVDNLSLIQEFKMINDSTWFLSRDKFVVELSLTGEKNLSAIGRKTTTYTNVIVNDTSVTNELAKNTIMEETILPDSVLNLPDSFWVAARHEPLTKNEQAIYQTIDTLLKMPAFQRTTRTVNFLATGYLNIGNYEIGPWYNWLTYNQLEGTRVRFDLATNRHFNNKITLHGYLAYGFGDHVLKGQADVLYLLSKEPRTSIFLSYKRDIDYGQNYYDEISQDNIFALAIRKSGVPIKFLMIDEKKAEVFKEWKIGLSATVTGLHKTFNPLLNLPSKTYFPTTGPNDVLSTSEVSLRLRYAYLEKFLENTFYRYSLGSAYPIVEVKYTRGISGLFNSSYDYNKLSASISDYVKISPYGELYYNVFGGRTFGTLPYMMLDIAPGNEIYYYNKYAFSLMNRYEYLHDRYAGINLEHNFGNGIFRFFKFTRKWKFRQFWTAKALWGSLSDANKAYNMPVGSDYTFQSLDGKTYLEVGTGVDNIFRLFRVDFVWRVLPQPLPPEKVKRFGVFGSFRLSF